MRKWKWKLSWSCPVRGRARTWVPCLLYTATAWITPPLSSAHQTPAQKHFILSLFTNVSLHSMSLSGPVLSAHVWRTEVICVTHLAQCPSQQPCRQKPKEELLGRETPGVGWHEGSHRAVRPCSQLRFKATPWDTPSSSTSPWLNGRLLQRRYF